LRRQARWLIHPLSRSRVCPPSSTHYKHYYCVTAHDVQPGTGPARPVVGEGRLNRRQACQSRDTAIGQDRPASNVGSLACHLAVPRLDQFVYMLHMRSSDLLGCRSTLLAEHIIKTQALRSGKSSSGCVRCSAEASYSSVSTSLSASRWSKQAGWMQPLAASGG
jgi:hypothetical protein